jgi:hypothetical protein
MSAPGVVSSLADKAARHAAIALAVTLPSDTCLYLLLPMFASDFGVSLFEVGVLLAANRLIRIVGMASWRASMQSAATGRPARWR